MAPTFSSFMIHVVHYMIALESSELSILFDMLLSFIFLSDKLNQLQCLCFINLCNCYVLLGGPNSSHIYSFSAPMNVLLRDRKSVV